MNDEFVIELLAVDPERRAAIIDLFMAKSNLGTMDQPEMGWMEAARIACGIGKTDVMKAAGLAENGYSGFNERSLTGHVRLSTLRDIASAMDCDLVYAFVPRKSVGDYLSSFVFDEQENRFLEVVKSVLPEIDAFISTDHGGEDKKKEAAAQIIDKIFSIYVSKESSDEI